MILIAGGTGFLGPRIVRLLTARGLSVRVMTRNPQRAESLKEESIEIVEGDVRNRVDVNRAANGASTVISAISGFGMRGVSPRSVDWQGNSNLIRAAVAANVEHFILVSIFGAASNHKMELYRMKYRAEQELKASGLAWTIIRPSIYIETWGKVMWEPMAKRGKTRIFGGGDNPINFVSAEDVARFVEFSVVDRTMRRVEVDVGGPENLTLKQFLQTFEHVAGTTGHVRTVPLWALRIMSVLARPVNPTIARLANAALIMDKTDMSMNAEETRWRFPSIPSTRVEEVVLRDYVEARSSRTLSTISESG